MGADIILAINSSTEPIQASATNKSNPTGKTGWYNINPGARNSWERSDWESIAFKNEDGSKRAGVYVPAGSVITFNDWDNIVVI